jgi:hypothetical protein
MNARGETGLGTASDSMATVRITARHLGTTKREEAILEVGSRSDEMARKNLLVDLVGARYPEARLRSYADRAASFLAPKLLVVAAYRELRSQEETATTVAPPGDDGQQDLFAA